MGFWDKVGFHIASNYLHGQAKGLSMGREAGKSISDSSTAHTIGSAVGFIGGSVIGAIGTWSPIGMIKTAMLSEEEMDRRMKEMEKTFKEAYEVD